MTHDQIREMVRRVNPIPDPSTLIVETPVPTTPLERRTDMQTDDRVVAEGGDKSRLRGPLVGIAAAAVILVAGAVYLLTNDDPPVATPAPNATLLTREMEVEPIDPGAYFADTDGDPATTRRGTFVIEGSGWSALQPGARYAVTEDVVVLMVAEVDKVGAPACGDAPNLQPAGTSAEDLANQFAAAGFSVQEAVSPVSAFGQSGYHLVVEVPPGCDSNANRVWEGPTFGRYYHQSPGQMVEYWFLDVEGTPVMVEASWMAEFAEEDVAQLRAAIDTLVITP
ncbi:MAG TPA: hypothetical protein VNT92_03860 [Acidimicrobiia bacterium]|nr:hypothetical protein [Acidimicrobiia bacterium]